MGRITHSDTTDEEELPDYVFTDGMVPCRALRTRGGYRQLKDELIRKRPDSPNMKDGELRPVLKQVRQNDDSDPGMDEPWTNYCKQYEKTVPIVWSAEAKDPQTSLSMKTLVFSSTFQKTLLLLIFLNCF